VAGLPMAADQRLALAEDDRLDELGHEVAMPGVQLRHFAAPEQLLAEVLVGLHVQAAVQVVLIEGIVAGAVALGVHQATSAQELAPGVIAVAGQQGVVQIEKGQGHDSPRYGYKEGPQSITAPLATLKTNRRTAP